MTQLSRRSLITGLISLVAAPAIVRVSSLMPVKVTEPAVLPITIEELLRRRIADAEKVLLENIKVSLYGDRYFGISGLSSTLYYSERLPLDLDGIRYET